MNWAKYTKWIAGIVLTASLIALIAAHRAPSSSSDGLLLLVPDEVAFSDPKVTMWIDAGDEQGLHVLPMHDSEFLRPFFQKTEFAGVILPDSVHQKASDVLISSVRQFVAAGGKLMLVYDAGTLSQNGRYAAGKSRFSDLAGVDYALYDTLHDKTTQWSKIKGAKSVFDQLDVPPGKYYPFEPASGTNLDVETELRRYMYGDLVYPNLTTSGDYSGRVLLHSDSGVAAGEHNYQSGKVLFVNIPLGYLKANTDGLLLHGFLNYFAEHTLSLPRLLPVPDGAGGLVLNWHVDSNAAIKPLQQMESWPFLQQGPYSVHITAGPDAMDIGDKRGFNVDNNPISQSIIREYEGKGYTIGSHGGWIHNYFAFHMERDNPKELEKYLSLNKEALERVTGKQVVEYSAPNGNQPIWVTHWLEAHGFIAYYFTGNSGMGPTHGYREGTRTARNIWAFPILHLNTAAAFEEFSAENISYTEIEHWFEAVTDFSVRHHAVRLLYFHPPGILPYESIIRQWLQKTDALRSEGKFRWYTMTEIANFLNARERVQWSVSSKNGELKISASHPDSLEHQAWSLPTDRFAQPLVVNGVAQVTKTENGWLIVAGNSRNLEVEAHMLSQ